jgi:aminopeptidase N
MKMKLVLVFCASICFLNSSSQSIDVQHYRFQLQLSDAADKIFGRSLVVVKHTAANTSVSLDLVQQKSGKGMKVDSVKGSNVTGFQQAGDRLIISLRSPSIINKIDSFEVVYSGTPSDGLIISKSKFGDRTFFSDNWPNRARHWIPCNDRPDDKASVEFIITAPAYYQVISNGLKIEETNLDKQSKLTHWKETIPIPTKVMVIGAAQFAVARVDTSFSIPVTAWVYPQNKNAGFHDYALSTSILKFFSDYVGPYAFEKLANVQSKTIFGGMENASAIFYAENSVKGDRSSEPLLSHEIAHQWFGNMVTEKNFSHLWLSEGFASYLTDIYFEKTYGRDVFAQRLQDARKQVIAYNRVNRPPLVDTVSALMDLLNPNSYQKGEWVLHMLRSEVGDAAFKKIIQAFYHQYKGKNADSRDFQKLAESVTGVSLTTFFDQWLYRPGVPKIKVQWNYSGEKVNLRIEHSGTTSYSFPLELGVVDKMGKQTVQRVTVSPGTSATNFSHKEKPTNIVLDPNTMLLFEGTISENR